MTDSFNELSSFMASIPAVSTEIANGQDNEGFWWIKFKIDINHPLAWNVVQELGHIMNYLSLNEKLPTIFFPVSAPPYMNGGPQEFLYWVVETKDKKFSPKLLSECLEARLPQPVDDLMQWQEE
jgi:hypothetical protein